MKLLRETIKQLLLENQSHYQKIATNILVDNPQPVHSALTLAETLQYVENLHSWKQPPTFEGTLHCWSFNAIPPLYAEIQRQHNQVSGHALGNPNMGISFESSGRITLKILRPQER